MPQKIDIQKWETSILCMDEDYFFDIIHAYFGEIETPFNKHKLLERLSSFLLNVETRKSIVNALNYEDLRLLSCISYLKNPSVSIIAYTFDTHASKIKGKLVNLEERLLIYRENDDVNYMNVQYSINPLLFDALRPFLGDSLFLPCERLEKPISIEPLLTPVFFSSFYSYISNNNDVFKKDGTCKKKVTDNLSAVFPELKGNKEIIELIFDCFINLKLIKKSENGITIMEEHWKRFALLSHFEKLIYMSISRVFCTAGCAISSAQIFSELLDNLKEGAWYNIEDLDIALFLILKKHFDSVESMNPDMDYIFFNAFRHSSSYEDGNIQLLSIAEKLGLLIRKKHLLMLNEYFREVQEDEKPLLLSSTYEATVSQNASLNNLLSILPGMKIVKSQTFATFEFSRQTCERLFQKEMDSKEIIEKLQYASKHTIPQNINASIEQWYKAYKSVSLYSGFVLCVDEKKRKFFESGTPLSDIVKKEISDGVYLLSNTNIKEINNLLKKAGLDFIFFNNKDCRVDLNLVYASLENNNKVCKTESKKELLDKLKKCEGERLLQEEELIEKLKKEKMDESVRDTLVDRIKRRVILNEKQLDPATVNRTVREIRGLDFLRKVKFLEEAKLQKHLLEITINDKDVVVGYVESVWKNFKDNTIVRIDDDMTNSPKIKYIDVSQILKIKVVVQSIFS